MAVTKCGVLFSWDTPMWCNPKDKEEKLKEKYSCDKCPLNIRFKEKATVFDEED